MMVCLGVWVHGQEPLNAVAVAEDQQFFLGESFVFQVQVSGSDSPEPLDLSGLKDFLIEELGGQQNNSQSVTIINGRMNKVVRRGYVFSYRLKPKREGVLSIPSLQVRADGQTTRTRPVSISIKKPEESNDFKLRMSLSQSRCYVGQPIILTVTWYLGQDVKSVEFDVPVLSDDRFTIIDPEVEIDQRKQYFRLPLGSGEVVAEKGRGSLDGRTFATLTFQKVLVPNRAGTITIPPATAACDALVGYRNSNRRSSSLFDDDFFSSFFNDDFFGRSRRGVYQKYVTPSKSISLRVRDVPEEGRPANFAGHLGSYSIRASATPLEVNVGDPITLTVTLNSPDYLDHVRLPPLHAQRKLAQDFKIPEDMADGKVEGKNKVFVQTIRARREDVTEIPSIELPYFDTNSGSYKTARTDPIPIQVRATKIVTASDAEGGALIKEGNAVVAWSRGIAHNYDDLSVVEDQRYGPRAWVRSPVLLFLILAPPFAFCVLLFGTAVVRRRNADPLANKARKAFGTLNKALNNAGKSSDDGLEMVLTSLREYLGDKLKMPGGSLTFSDVQEPLDHAGVTGDTLDDLKDLFAACEASQYAGASESMDLQTAVERARHLAKMIERRLK